MRGSTDTAGIEMCCPLLESRLPGVGGGQRGDLPTTDVVHLAAGVVGGTVPPGLVTWGEGGGVRHGGWPWGPAPTPVASPDSFQGKKMHILSERSPNNLPGGTCFLWHDNFPGGVVGMRM